MAFMSMIVAYTFVVCIVSFIAWIIREIGYFMVFKKAGHPGWTAFIPVYSSWRKADIAGHGIYYLFWIVCSAASGLFLYYSDVLSYAFSGAQMVMIVFGYVFLLLAFIIQIAVAHCLSRAFGHGAGYTLGLIFLPTVFAFVLGFGSSEYVRE